MAGCPIPAYGLQEGCVRASNPPLARHFVQVELVHDAPPTRSDALRGSYAPPWGQWGNCRSRRNLKGCARRQFAQAIGPPMVVSEPPLFFRFSGLFWLLVLPHRSPASQLLLDHCNIYRRYRLLASLCQEMNSNHQVAPLPFW